MSVNKDITTIYKPHLPHVLSLGAGVQSSTLALMAANGMVQGYPQLTAAVFADTQDEPASVYKWLDWLEAEIARCPFPFPVHRVTKGRLIDGSLKTHIRKRDGSKSSSVNIPLFVKNADGSQGRITHRNCTIDYKIKPVTRELRKIAGIKRGQKEIGVVQWIGISLDEVRRMKDGREPWAENCWPLIDMRMNRNECKMWMKTQGYPEPPRSACVYCPFHNNHEWRRLKKDEPEAFALAVDVEKRLQQAKNRGSNMDATPYLHRSCVPLDQVDLSTEEDHGQLDLWTNECEGMCGL